MNKVVWKREFRFDIRYIAIDYSAIDAIYLTKSYEHVTGMRTNDRKKTDQSYVILLDPQYGLARFMRITSKKCAKVLVTRR